MVATADPDHPAVIDQAGAALSHGELLAAAEAAATGLVGLGLERGDHLGVFLPNRAPWPVLALAAARSGIGILGLNTRFRHAELDHLLAVADVDRVVVADRFLGVDGPALLGELERDVLPIVIGDASGDAVPYATVATGGDGSAESAPVGRSSDPLIGFTTSGTTGFPKVAMHDQAQTVAHLSAVIDAVGLGADTVALVPLPLCGAFGYTTAMATLLAGGMVVVHETWDPDAAAAAIRANGVTYLNASDDMILALLASPQFEPETTWRHGGFADFTNAGTEALTAAEVVTGGRTRLTGLYGSSEGFALMSTWHRDDPSEVRGRNGGRLVGSTMAVRCCDPATGLPVPDGTPGELQFRGPNLIAGYLANRAATEQAFTDDGWYRSGDLGIIDPEAGEAAGANPAFVFQARLGDSLRLRGFLCDPAEIEHHLEGHPAVDLAQVVGVDRPGRGDAAVAFVRLHEDAAAGAGTDDVVAELDDHCRTGLANYKRPERIVVVDEFPVTDGPNGVKIRKVDLRERAAALLA